MPDDLTQRVIGVIAKTQHLPPENIAPESTFQDLGIDSLDGINILFGLENEFDISIPDDAAQEIKGVPQAVAGIRTLLERKAAAPGA
jgi:acyl carrier protein